MKPWMLKLARFFAGRYGVDSLYTALTVGALALIFANLFLQSWIVDLLILAMLAWSMFRTFSRNHAARRRENDLWVKIWKKITFGKGPVRDGRAYPGYGNYGSFGGYNSGYGTYGYPPPKPPRRKKKKLKTDKDHCFRICPECKANIRLPKQRGKHTVVCPRCKCRFEVRI